MLDIGIKTPTFGVKTPAFIVYEIGHKKVTSPLLELSLVLTSTALFEADDDGLSKCACFVNSCPVTPF